ncbi:MAG TPA: CBS domain-containing protein [Candidatus Limnocylindria bacterium]|nr:CBS domain-containing protein [Candidatus Limnocylindria bacterium]
MKVADVMTRDVVSVAPATPLREVAQLLTEHRISGVPVVDEAGTCVGIVSEADLLPKQLSRRPSQRQAFEWLLGDRVDPEEMRRKSARTAVQAMSAPVATIAPDRPVREAAGLMVECAVNRLPVVSEGTLVGIITRADLVRAYLGLDDDILRTIRDQVLRKTMWLDPAGFTIEVSDGRVRIGGHVDRRSTARIIARLIGVVDGVAEVASAIGWDFDDSHLDLPIESEPVPGSASLTARRAPQPMHR